MKIVLASDHAGFELKEEIKTFLEEKGHAVQDIGAFNKESCHYPVYGRKAAELVAAGECEKGVLVCGTGIGISLAANKVKGIRCAVVSDTFSAKMARAHNDANMLAVGARVVGGGLALAIVEAWLEAEFEGGRHQERVNMIEDGGSYGKSLCF